MADLDLLRRLLDAPGVAGRESAIRALIRSVVEARDFFDDIREDALGNLICRRFGQTGGDGARRILLAAHMDQAGFLVSYISECGALSLHPVGSFDLRALASQPVLVVPEQGAALPGTLHLSAKPVHTACAADLSRQPQLADFHVDLGLPGEAVRAKVRPGDMVVFRSPMQQIGNDIVGAGLDDRIGCWALIEALALIDTRHDDLICAFTVQEELGSRGAGPVAHAVAPDIAVICETVVSCRVTGIAQADHITVPGQGIALQVADSSLISDPGLIEIAERAAKARGLPVQRSLMLGGGQDGAIIQRSGAGVRTIALGCPLKFMHASREQANRSDILSYPPLILYTSGTTGRGKAVPRSHRAERAASLAHVAQNALLAGDVALGVMPLYHTMGLRILLSSALLSGSFVCQPRFKAAETLDLIAAHRISSLYLVPTLYHDLMSELPGQRRDLSSIARLGFAGASMSEGLLRRVGAAFPGIPLVNHYGSSEIYTFTIAQDAAGKPGSAGRAGLNARIAVIPLGSTDISARAAPGQEGQVIADAGNIEAFGGYLNRPDADAAALRQGWYLTGDVGYLDAEGDLF